MQRASFLAVLILACATQALAGNVIGSITEDGKPIAKGVKIEITCGAKTYTAETDANGAFKQYVAETGKCALKFPHQGSTPTFDINSYEGSVQYDLILEKKDGKYTPEKKVGMAEKEVNKKKDLWDKVDVIFRPLNGLLTALAVGLLGYYTSNTLRERETNQTNERVYTELMSSRELAESGLRKDMFLSTVQSFGATPTESLDKNLLNLEMLAYNFHESLILKPLFDHMDRQIRASTDSQKAAHSARLKRVAVEITTRQMVLLEQVGAKYSRSVDFGKLAENPGGIDLEPETLKLNNVAREFSMSVIRVDKEKKELTMELAVRTPQESNAQRRLQFHVGYFDFPMIDNTRLSLDHRVAVILNQASDDGADITLVLFPGSYASLKEHVSYDVVLQNLRNMGADGNKNAP